MKMIVLGRNAQGEPEFHSCDVEAGQEAIDNGDHYNLAKENAEYNGFEGTFMAFDENDVAAKQLPELAEWMSGKPILNAITKSVYTPLWLVIHSHQEGTTDYPCYSQEKPNAKDVIGADLNPDKGEFGDVYGPFMAPSTDTAMRAFITNVANLQKWTDDDQETSECKKPSEGAWDSHTCLMDLIDEARKTLQAGDGKQGTPQDTDKVAGYDRAKLFMQELLDSVETLSGIADQFGAQTLADLIFLQNAILSGGFIDYYPGQSEVMNIARGLPSGEQWSKFIKVEYMLLRPITHSGGVKSISDDDLCARCCHCKYRPGTLSDCDLDWPGLEDEDSYVQECPQLAIVPV